MARNNIKYCPFCDTKGRIYAHSMVKKYDGHLVRRYACSCGGRWSSVEISVEDYEDLTDEIKAIKRLTIKNQY